MKSWRERYFEDFEPELIPANNKKGQKVVYTYTGNWYSWSDENGALTKRRVVYVAIALVVTVINAICGVQRSFVNMSNLVAVPGIISIVTQMYEWIGILQFCLSKKEMYEKDCKKTYSSIRTSSLLTAICLTFSTLFGTGLLICRGVDIMSLFVVLGFSLCAILSWILFAYHKKLCCVKISESKIVFDEMPYE